MITYFVIQAFQRGNKGMLIPDSPRQARDRVHCEGLAERLAETHASVIAFSRCGNPETGEWEDAVILSQYGEPPAEALELLN